MLSDHAVHSMAKCFSLPAPITELYPDALPFALWLLGRSPFCFIPLVFILLSIVPWEGLGWVRDVRSFYAVGEVRL